MEPNLDQSDNKDELAGDLLVGGDAIRDYLVFLGFKTVDPYYLKRSGGGWPIGKTGGQGGSLIASKRKLARHLQKITTP